MEIPREVVVALIGAIPALAAPLFSSLLQRRGAAQKSRDVELLEKRVNVIERLLALDKYLPDDHKAILRSELADITQDLVAERVRERAAGGTIVERLSVLRRFFLIYEQPTTRATIYRGFFWFFLFIAVGIPLSIIPAMKLEGAETWPITFFGTAFYGMVALFFRSAAIRQQKRAQTAAAEHVSSRAGS